MCRSDQEYYLLFDVGGTCVKACAVRKGEPELEKLELPDRLHIFPALSGETENVIFHNFADAIRFETGNGDREITEIGMAFPGPFDYENGISRMRGIGKYDDIYGLRIADEINRLLKGSYRFRFLHDIEAFALGECRFGTAKGAGRVFHLCIGTGTGSVFTDSGVVLKRAEEGIPENGWIYSCRFRDGRIDDYLSARGLERLAEREFGRRLDGKQLYDMACGPGESAEKQGAHSVFREFGKDIAEAVEPFLMSFHPDKIVLGGQIASAYEFFGGELEKLCREQEIETGVVQNTSSSIIKGLYCHMESHHMENNQRQEN